MLDRQEVLVVGQRFKLLAKFLDVDGEEVTLCRSDINYGLAIFVVGLMFS